MTAETPINATFVALHALPAISPGIVGPIGGTETRAWILARGLANQNSRVAPSIVVRGGDNAVPASVEGMPLISKEDRLYDLYVNVGRSVTRTVGFPGLRITRWDPRLLWQLPVVAFHRLVRSRPTDPTRPEPFFVNQQADVFVAFGVQSTAATVVASAHASNRRAIVVLGCDDDLDDRYLSDPQFVNPYGDSARVCRWILENADLVLTQSDWQQQTLKDRFGRDGNLIPNPIDLSCWSPSEASKEKPPTGIEAIDRMVDGYVLWVGRAEGVHKRPQKLIEVAEHCPDVPFVMVLNPADPDLEHTVRESCPSNVTIVDRVSPRSMPAVFERAAVLVNTSSTEGFPNTFLQAAAMGIPVLSLAVLGPFLVENRLGMAFDEDVPALAEMLSGLCEGKLGGEPFGFDASAARRYVEQRHGLERVVHQFAEAVARVLD